MKPNAPSSATARESRQKAGSYTRRSLQRLVRQRCKLAGKPPPKARQKARRARNTCGYSGPGEERRECEAVEEQRPAAGGMRGAAGWKDEAPGQWIRVRRGRSSHERPSGETPHPGGRAAPVPNAQAQRRRGGAAQERAARPAVRCSDWLGNGATLRANRTRWQDKKQAGHRKAGAACDPGEKGVTAMSWRTDHPQPGE